MLRACSRFSLPANAASAPGGRHVRHDIMTGIKDAVASLSAARCRVMAGWVMGTERTRFATENVLRTALELKHENFSKLT